MKTFWTVASFIGLGGAAYWFARQAMVARGQPTSDTSVGAVDPPSAWGPQLRKKVGELAFKLGEAGVPPDGEPNPVEVDWRTVTFFFKDVAAEAIAKAADLLPRSASLDGKFYHFVTQTVGRVTSAEAEKEE